MSRLRLKKLADRSRAITIDDETFAEVVIPKWDITGNERINRLEAKKADLGEENCFKDKTELVDATPLQYFGDPTKTLFGARFFSGCTGLKKVVIPAHITNMSGNVSATGGFCNCSALEEITWLGSIVSANDFVFQNAGSVKKRGYASYDVFWGTDFPSTAVLASDGDIYINGVAVTEFTQPSNVTIVGGGLFSYAEKVTKVALHSGCTAINKYAFLCANGINLSGTTGVTVLRADSFANSKNMVFSSDFSSLTTIEKEAFCRAKTDSIITIPTSVTTVGDYAFLMDDSSTQKVSVNLSAGLPNVTSIGQYAFSGTTITACASTLKFADNVSIGNNAFENCALGIVDLSNASNNIGSRVFQGSTLTKLIIGSNISKLNYALCANSGVTDIVISGTNNLVTIDGYVCDGATSFDLSSNELFEKVTTIGNFAFRNTKVGNSLDTLELPLATSALGGSFLGTSIKKLDAPNLTDTTAYNTFGSFATCTSLTEVSVPKLANIGAYCFNGCSALVTFNSGSGVIKTIGGQAFENCPLKSLDLSECTTIGNYAFRNGGLESVSAPKCISLGGASFSGCASLTSASFPEITKVQLETFKDAIALETVNVPKATVFENYAFANCKKITASMIPTGLESIGGYCFSGCTALVLTSLPESVTTISYNAFHSCENVKITTLPSNLSVICSNAFSQAGEVGDTITMPSTTKVTLGGDIFGRIYTPFKSSVTTVKVPADLVAEYQADANWSSLGLTFEAIS